MDPWERRYRAGSFRGVPFRTESHQETGGRRKQKHEFASKNIGNSEDLGQKLADYTLNLYVLGDDYFTDRDALRNALKQEGPGILVHPYLGTLNVQVGAYTLSESSRERRIARFSVEFDDAGEVKFPDQITDDVAGVTDNADDAIGDAQGFFEDVFSVANQPAQVLNAAADNVRSVTRFLERATKKVTDTTTNLTFAIRRLEADVNNLIQAPGELAARIADSFNTLLNEFSEEPETSSSIFRSFNKLDDEFEPVIGTTPSRNKERENQEAIKNLARQLALCNNAKAVAEIDFLSTRDALLKRDEIIDEIDVQVESADDELFQSLKNVQASLTKILPRTGTSELITITPPKTVPAIVLAYNLFENLDKEEEIIQENKIEHPGFVPGGDPINVSAG